MVYDYGRLHCDLNRKSYFSHVIHHEISRPAWLARFDISRMRDRKLVAGNAREMCLGEPNVCVCFVGGLLNISQVLNFNLNLTEVNGS